MSDYMKEAERLVACLRASLDDPMWADHSEISKATLRAAIAHIQRGAVPDGWQVVPIDPSPGMLDAAEAVDWGDEDTRGSCCNQWHAMLAAAPDQFRDATKMMAEPAEVPVPEPEFVLSYDGWHRRYLLKKMPVGSIQVWGEQAVRTYGAACRAAGEAAGYARGLAEAGRDAERSRRWISVTDENPGQGPCIVFSTWGVRYAYRHNPAWMDGFQDGETKIDEGSDHPSMTFSETFRVTHWMPWPSPPIAAMRGEVK